MFNGNSHSSKTLHVHSEPFCSFSPHPAVVVFALFSIISAWHRTRHKIINQNNENVKEEEKVLSFEQRSSLLLLREAASVCDDPLFEKMIKAVREKTNSSDFVVAGNVYALLAGE